MDYKMLSLKIFSLLFGLCAYHFTISVISVGAQPQEVPQCGRDGELQARQCLNVTDTTIDPPSPVILEATVEGDFICKDKPLLYSFSCTLYGYDLIWHFDNEPLTSFHPTHMDRFRVFPYPLSAPYYYNITAVLAQVSNATIGRYNAPFCVSVLTVQPYNESDIQVLPFTVSCQTYCQDGSAICQTKHYGVAAKPGQPHGTNGDIIHAILDNDQSEDSGIVTRRAAIASLNWSPPENHNETAIDFYELMLIGTPNNNTFFYKATGNMAQQTFSFKYALPRGNYTAVRITAIDLCEQRSESSLSNINNSLIIETVATCTTSESVINSQIDELNDTINILAGVLASIIALLIGAIIIITALIVVHCKCGPKKGAESDIKVI